MQVLKLPRRALHLAYQSWQKRRYRGELLRYHIKPKEDGRNLIARWLDFYGILLVMWVVSLFFFATLWSQKVALAASLALSAGTGLLAARLQRKRHQREMHYCKLRALGEQYKQRIKQFNTGEELASFLLPILQNLPQFEQVRPKGKKKKKTADQPTAVIQAVYRGLPVIVKFLPAGQSPVGVTPVHNLVEMMEKQGYRHAMMVTPGEFAPETIRLVASLRKRYRIALVAERELLFLVAQAQQEKQPYDQSISVKTAPLQSLHTVKRLALDPRKGRSYLTAGALLIVSHFFLGVNHPAAKLYLALAAVNLILAILCLILKRREETPLELNELQPQN